MSKCVSVCKGMLAGRKVVYKKLKRSIGKVECLTFGYNSLSNIIFNFFYFKLFTYLFSLVSSHSSCVQADNSL